MGPGERPVTPAREPGQWRYWAYRTAAIVVPRVPYVVAAPVAAAVGLALWAVNAQTRRRVGENLAHVPALAADHAARAVAVRGVFHHLALNYLDLFRVRTLGESAILRDWQLDGIEHYERSRNAGRGVILVTGHLGNFDHAAARVGIFGTPITIPVERLKPERLFALVRDLRTHHHVQAVPADTTEGLRALLSALRRGEAVLLAVDRDVLGSGVATSLFGAPARLPLGAALLAQRSGAPVLWASGYRDGLRRSRGAFVPIELPSERLSGAAGHDEELGVRTNPRAGEYSRMLAPITEELERQIIAHPEQWMASLARIWSDTTRQRDAITVGWAAPESERASEGSHPLGLPEKSL